MAAIGDRQRARRIPDAEWEVWRQELVRLYVEEDVSRKDIIHLMANEHNFAITDTQLKHRFQKWDVKKNINDDDMTTMLALKRKRQALGKDIRFQYKGHDVEQERLERAYKRQRRQLASPTFIQPYIKVYTSPNQSPQPASQVFLRGYSASQGLERHFNPSTSDINSQNMQASFLMEWTNDSLDPGQYGYTHNTRGSGFAEVTQTSQTSQAVLMVDATLGPVNSSSGPETGEGGFNPNGYEALSTEGRSVLDENQASSDNDMDQPCRNGSTFSSGAWESLMNWSPSPAPSVLAIDDKSRDRLSLSRDTVASPTIDDMPILRSVESEEGSLSTELRVQIVDDQPLICADFDPSSALLPLLLMKAHLEQNFCSDPDLGYHTRGSNLAKLFNTIHSEWLRLELDNVVCWTSDRVSKDIRERQVRRRIGKFASPFEKSCGPLADRRRSDDGIETDDEVQIIETSYARSKSHKGVLQVTLGNFRERETFPNAPEALTVSFIPKESRRTIGLCATFVSVMSEVRSPRISPRLRTFNVVPDDSEIINCIMRNDLSGLQALFDNREASPTDVDSTGFSLLSYAIYYGNCEIFRLLLECGADTQTCNTFGFPSDMVCTTWTAFGEAYKGGSLWGLPRSIIRSTDQCMSMSDAALRYGCDIDNSIALNSRLPNPLFIVVDEYSIELTPQALMDALRYMCNIGYDIEERNSEGATLLLFEASRLCPSVISILKFLIEKGADLCAVDPYNRGALHSALTADYGWHAWAWGSSCTDACDHLSYDHELWASWSFSTESESYAEDYCNEGLTPAPSAIDDIQNDHLACDDGVQERLYRASGGNCPPTTRSTRPGSHSPRSRSGHYIDLDEANDDNEDDEKDREDEDEEDENGKDFGEEEDESDEADEEDHTEAREKPEGYVLCYDSDEDSLKIIRKPLPILKTRLRFKLLTLLRAGCDPNLLDNGGNSPSDDARRHGLWPEWTWALLNAGYVFDEGSNRWVKRLEEEASFG